VDFVGQLLGKVTEGYGRHRRDLGGATRHQVDRELCLFGSLNLDPRSLYLNFEITLAVYDHAFTSQLRSLQEAYAAESSVMTLDHWTSRSRHQKFIDNVARLLSPLL